MIFLLYRLKNDEEGGFLFPSAISFLYLICNEQLGPGSLWPGAGRFWYCV